MVGVSILNQNLQMIGVSIVQHKQNLQIMVGVNIVMTYYFLSGLNFCILSTVENDFSSFNLL